MNLVEVVILVGAQCVSPIESGPGLTEVGKVSCAVLVTQDPATSEIAFLPPSAATDPNVVAMLVKPRPGSLAMAPANPAAAQAADDMTGSITPAPPPKIVPASSEVVAEEGITTPKTMPRKQQASRPAEKSRMVARRDACGSYKAVWYTNKDGHRRYRCVRAG